MSLQKTSLLIPIFLTISCSIVPLTGRRQFTAIPSSQLISLSKENYIKMLDQEKISDNRTYINMVQDVGSKISVAVERYLSENGMKDEVKNYDWEYTVLKSDEKNAWCMPGGKIAFYEGIMPICEDKNGVATVMAHEVAHAVARHGNERMSQQMALQLGGMALSEALQTKKEQTQQLALLAFGVGSQLGVVLPYSRTHEKEADELGLYFMAMAGYNPQKAIEFWKRMEQAGSSPPPEFLSTHPNPETRMKNLNRHMSKALAYYNN